MTGEIKETLAGEPSQKLTRLMALHYSHVWRQLKQTLLGVSIN